MEDVKLCGHLQNDKRTKSELKKLTSLFRDIPKDKKELCVKLIENASFMAILLDDLQDDIRNNGFMDIYTNGEHQKGRKRSVAADLYMTTVKNYSSVIKQLTDLLPDNQQAAAGEALKDFLAAGKK